jgi:hypothetical protein
VTCADPTAPRTAHDGAPDPEGIAAIFERTAARDEDEPRGSLAPSARGEGAARPVERSAATSYRALYDAQGARLPLAVRPALRAGLVEVDRALREHFPDNVYGDLDAMVHDFVTAVLEFDPPRAAAALTRRFEAVAELFARYGEQGPIRFRYAHDLLYGFDWAKWRWRAVHGECGVGEVRGPVFGDPGPWSLPFLKRMRCRACELEGLIAAGDATYPPLLAVTPHAELEHRNPFRFARDREAETRLYRELARRDLLPVAAWSAARDRRDAWARTYAALREETARDLGLER